MKNLSLLILLFVFSSSTVMFGQNGKKGFKEGEKLAKKFIKDVTSDEVDIEAALAMLASAFDSEEVSGDAKYYIKHADILRDVSEVEYLNSTLNPEYLIRIKDAATNSYNLYLKAMDMGETKKALKGLMAIEGPLNNFGAYFYNKQDYTNAFINFQNSLKTKEVLSSNSKESRLDDENLYKDQVLFTGVSAYYSEDKSAGLPYFEQLNAMGSTDPVVYEALYTMLSETNPDKALAYLEEGREKNPEDTGMLFTEINHYLKSGELEKLINKLQLAIEAEPDNVTVYVTLGSVFDQLSQKESKAGNADKAAEYFDKAKEQYIKASSIDDTNFDAAYSLGALHYNKAAAMVDDLNTLAADFTSEGMKKYDAKKAEMDGLFEIALPHFTKAESLNGSDRNTLIALKEIHARLNDLEKSNEYKIKLEGM